MSLTNNFSSFETTIFFSVRVKKQIPTLSVLEMETAINATTTYQDVLARMDGQARIVPVTRATNPARIVSPIKSAWAMDNANVANANVMLDTRETIAKCRNPGIANKYFLALSKRCFK